LLNLCTEIEMGISCQLANFVDSLMPISVLVWVHSFIALDFFENNDNATPIYLINLLWTLWLD